MFWVATVLTACGIETLFIPNNCRAIISVATVLTACGIETLKLLTDNRYYFNKLQQCLPLAVLKLVTSGGI